jgi:hypothetical protein
VVVYARCAHQRSVGILGALVVIRGGSCGGDRLILHVIESGEGPVVLLLLVRVHHSSIYKITAKLSFSNKSTTNNWTDQETTYNKSRR